MQEASEASGVSLVAALPSQGQRDELPRCQGSGNLSYFSQEGLALPFPQYPCAWESSRARALAPPSSPEQEGTGWTLCHSLLASVLPVALGKVGPLFEGFVTMSSLLRIGTCFLLSRASGFSEVPVVRASGAEHLARLPAGRVACCFPNVKNRFLFS